MPVMEPVALFPARSMGTRPEDAAFYMRAPARICAECGAAKK
jgi:hypothetical protein